MELNSAYVPALIGMLGVVAGALSGSYFNNRFAKKYAKKDIFFKKKLEYFENLAKTIETNRRMYRNAINEIMINAKKDNIKKIMNNLKTERKNFLISSSPLYFNTKKIGRRITNFVKIEKDIFGHISILGKSQEKEREMQILEEDLEKLMKWENLIIKSMKIELRRDI